MVLLVLPPCELDHPGRKFQPLGISYIASYLRKNGRDCEVIDGLSQSEFNDKDKIVNYILTNNFKIVGFSVNTIAFETALYIANNIKKYNKDIITVFGGHHSTYMHEDILVKNNCVDFVVRGEGEKVFLELVNAINGDKRFELINGISYRDKNASIVINKKSEAVKNLDELPFPSRIDSKFYSATFDKESNKYLRNISIISSRGCVNNCSFCSVHFFQDQMNTERYWRSRSPENVAQEAAELVLKNKNEDIFLRFTDDNFLVDISRSMNIAQKIVEYCGKKVKFSFSARCDQIIRCGFDRLNELRNLGCVNIEIGIESGSDSFLKRYCKDTSVEINELALALLKKSNITPSIDFLMFDPSTTMQEIEENFEFIKRNNLSGHYPPIIYNRVIPFPGTDVYKTSLIDKNNYFRNKSVEYIFNMLNQYGNQYQHKIDDIINNITMKSSLELKILSQFAKNKPYDLLEELILISNSQNFKSFGDLEAVKSTEELINTILERIA